MFNTNGFTRTFDNHFFENGLTNSGVNYTFIKKFQENTDIDSIKTLASHLEKADLLSSEGKYKDAIKYYLEAFKEAKKEKDWLTQLRVKEGVAYIKNQISDLQGALKIHQENLEFLETKKKLSKAEQSLYMDILFNLGRAYLYLNEYEKAEFYSGKMLEYCQAHNDLLNEAKALCNLGGTYSFVEKYADALENLNKAETLISNSENEFLRELINLHKGRTLYEIGEYEEAISELLKINENKNPLFGYLDYKESYSLLAKSYQEINDNEKTVTYFERSMDVLTLIDQQRLWLKSELINEFNMTLANDQIRTLTGITTRKRTQLYILSFLGLFLLIGFFILHRSIRLRNEKKYLALIEKLDRQKVKSKAVKSKNTEKKGSGLTDDKVNEILSKLEKFESSEEYLANNLTLAELAKKLKTNTTYLSKIINIEKGLSFSRYLTEFRINYALKRLKEDPKFRLYSISSVAQEVGFKSAEPFAKAFKAKTGIYPSYYIKKLQEEDV
ncbi:helix-turn-helix domain-containing protein [Leptobacterium flavescens]|uniref:Helix-turn-helix domain-containing protein n=1 Tax=Leptobacterium flavescens TaxID=472055 RepID=A0A6P0UPL7_9FLAO|nr:helix-turn-helix domain-containing protein [Leptobacterium flavescens]NER15284.1 helix-turn-helix domain-containing protein [Leptobacterium flavescens]